MSLKMYSPYEKKENIKQLNPIDRIRYFIGMKRVNRAINKARKKHENGCMLSYWIVESVEEELKQKGYEVVKDEIQFRYSCCKYTHISFYCKYTHISW